MWIGSEECSSRKNERQRQIRELLAVGSKQEDQTMRRPREGNSRNINGVLIEAGRVMRLWLLRLEDVYWKAR